MNYKRTIFITSILLKGILAFGQLNKGQYNPIGNASIRSYVSIKKPLPSIDLGDRNISFVLEFSSDPKKEPSMFGGFWSIPLFDSSAICINKVQIEWKAPNGMSYFFNKVIPKNNQKLNYDLYSQNNDDWIAKVAKTGEISIENGKDNQCKYEYKDSKLVRFCAGKDKDNFTISYLANGRVKLFVNIKKQKPVMEISYSRVGNEVESIKFEDGSVYSFKYTDGNITSPDGVKRYSNYNIKLLSEILYPNAQTEQFVYTICEPKMRTVVLKDFKEAKTPILPINRMTQKTSEGNESYVEWCAITGVIVSDSGGDYKVGNEIYDKYFVERRANLKSPTQGGRTIPTFVSIAYTKTGSKTPDRYFYDWVNAVKILSDSNTGETKRYSMIGAKGPSYLKLRKIETLEGTDLTPERATWALQLAKSYDNKGNLIRELDGLGNVKEFSYDKFGRLEKVLKNGAIESENIYGENGVILKSMFFSGDKKINREYNLEGNILRQFTNDEKEYENTYDDKGRLKEVQFKDMKRQYFYDIENIHYEVDLRENDEWQIRKIVRTNNGTSMIWSKWSDGLEVIFDENMNEKMRGIDKKLISDKFLDIILAN